MTLPPVLEIRPLAHIPDADVRVPGSKSLTNRALVCAALATGVSRLTGILVADDTLAMLQALENLGAGLQWPRGPGDAGLQWPRGPGDADLQWPRGPGDADLRRTTATDAVEVTGWQGAVPAGPATLDVRLSGTTARFLAPLLTLGRGRYVLDAAAPFRARPMGPLLDRLGDLGADVDYLDRPGQLPAAITAGVRPPGRQISVAGDVSSQFLSGLLLVAPALPEGLEVTVTTRLVSTPYVELTIAAMEAFGAQVHRPGPDRFQVDPTGYRACDYAVEPDASAASYFLAAAAITGGRVRVRGLTPQARQGDVRFAEVLAQMGAEVHHDEHGLEVRGPTRLQGVEVDLADLSDTAQTLAAVAVFAEGPTRVTGIGFIRHKETDRVAAVVTELRRLGIDAREEEDGFLIHPGTPHAGTVRTYDDHRMAMSFALLGLRVPGIRIADPGCVAKTFPDYFEALEQLRR